MSEIENTLNNIEGVEEKQKPKYYTSKHRDYMRAYRAKYGSYTEIQKRAIKKYTTRLQNEAKQFRELQAKGLIPVQ